MTSKTSMNTELQRDLWLCFCIFTSFNGWNCRLASSGDGHLLGALHLLVRLLRLLIEVVLVETLIAT